MDGPVTITDRGVASHVLMTMSDYERLLRQRFGSLADALAQPGDDDWVELELPERSRETPRIVEFD